MSKIKIRGVPFDDVNMNEAVECCCGWLDENGARVIHTPNAEIVQLCVEKNEYYRLINSADLIIPDGAGVILASKLLRSPLKKGKVAGIELCENLIRVASERGKSVYFLGGKPDVARIASEKMKEKYPGLTVAGFHDGYFRKIDSLENAEAYSAGNKELCPNEDAAVIKDINDSGADILLVCLGVPKQEIWMSAHRGEINVSLMGGFGGSFDIYSGISQRAPRIFIKLGLEWFYRLLKEPARIGRMMKLPKFVLGTIFGGSSEK